MATDLSVVTAELPVIDNCPVMARTQAFAVAQGQAATLEHQFRGTDGRPRDLSGLFPTGSGSSSSAAAYRVVLRIREATDPRVNCTINPLWEVEGSVVDAAGGVLRADLPAEVRAHAGVYTLAWAVVGPDDVPVAVDTSFLTVERSLFGTLRPQHGYFGPPTLREVRMALMDSDPAENSLLARVEFGTDQVLTALTRPVMEFNEAPPKIGVFTTKTFRWREAWLRATVARLLETAAHNYRRNQLQYSSGGTTVDDKNKEREYLGAAARMLAEWQTFLTLKKVEINHYRVGGYFGSPYGRR